MQAVSLLLVALSTIGALAAPTSNITTRANPVTKRFKVDVPSRFGAVRSPHEQIRRTFAKYGWEIIKGEANTLDSILDEEQSSATKTVTVTISIATTAFSGPTSHASYANSSILNTSPVTRPTVVLAPIATTSQDGISEATASAESGGVEYLAPVVIGGQVFNLDFDTGSADLWVFSTRQPLTEIGTHAAFNPAKSSTWADYPGARWEILYGDNSSASGDVGFDHVTVGDMTVTKQAVELATEVSNAFQQDIYSDGLIGLGFSIMNTVQPVPQKTWLENILDQLDQPLFTADLQTGTTSTYEFGVIDASKFTGEVHYAPVDNSIGYWQFESKSYTIGNMHYDCTDCSPSIADTGTSLILLDPHVVEAYYAQVNSAVFNNNVGGYIFECNAALPNFGVAVGDYTATLQSSGLTWTQVGNGLCFGAIQSNQGSGLQIYGDSFFQQFYAVFDAGNLTFGVAAKNVA